MAKYSFELKKKIVLEYLNEEVGYTTLAQKYGIPAIKSIETWVYNYNTFGDKGLFRSRKNGTYSFEKKLSVVELYMTTEVSYQQLALQENILNPSIIVRWVNDFRIAGADALRPKKKGRKKDLKLPKEELKSNTETNVSDVSTERIRQLEDELLKLRIENAYLKELRRLRLEEETLLKKQRESSTASEETSD